MMISMIMKVTIVTILEYRVTLNIVREEHSMTSRSICVVMRS